MNNGKVNEWKIGEDDKEKTKRVLEGISLERSQTAWLFDKGILCPLN